MSHAALPFAAHCGGRWGPKRVEALHGWRPRQPPAFLAAGGVILRRMRAGARFTLVAAEEGEAATAAAADETRDGKEAEREREKDRDTDRETKLSGQMPAASISYYDAAQSHTSWLEVDFSKCLGRGGTNSQKYSTS